jgi:hydroxyacylglutathione hydrolase
VNVVRIEHPGLGNTSYVVEVGRGRAVAVDPDRRVTRYLDAAATNGWELAAVLDTHVHADFVTGSLELRERTGATLFVPKDAGIGFPHRGVVAGERLDLGDVEVEVLASAGHTPEHVSYVVRTGPTEAPTLFSGGALIAGGAARTDLVAPDMTEPLTRAEFHTLHEAFAGLPDATLLKPTHGGGSFCSVGGGRVEATTLGSERATNPLMSAHDEEDFVRWWPTTFPSTPAYFHRMRAVNIAGPRSLADISPPPPLDPERFAQARAAGALVVDVRRTRAYAEGHVPGSLAVHFRDAFATWLGWLVAPDVPLLFVSDGVPIERVIEESLLVGYERFAGYLDRGFEAWREAGLPVSTLRTVGPEEASALLDDGALPLDVREPDEFGLGHLAGAVLVPLGALAGRTDELPAPRPLLTYCSAGERSATATSILERAGIGPVLNLKGGYGAWEEAGRD